MLTGQPWHYIVGMVVFVAALVLIAPSTDAQRS
jgi:hypothetical protein